MHLDDLLKDNDIKLYSYKLEIFGRFRSKVQGCPRGIKKPHNFHAWSIKYLHLYFVPPVAHD